MNSIFKILDNKEIEIISSLSVIEYKYYSVIELFDIFQVEKEEHLEFFETIHELYKKKYLDKDKDKYSIKFDKKKSILKYDLANTENCTVIINYLYIKLKEVKLPVTKKIIEITKQTEILIESVKGSSLALANLIIRLYVRYDISKNYKKALSLNKRAIKILKSIDDKHPILAFCYRDGSFLYSKLGKTTQALKLNKKDINLLESYSSKYNYLLSDSYQAISKTYEDAEDFYNAIEYSHKALQIEQKLYKDNKNSNKLSALYNNLSHYYYRYDDYEGAIFYINKAIELYKKNKNQDNSIIELLLKNKKHYSSVNGVVSFIKKYKYAIIALLILLGIAITYLIASLFL